MGNRSDNDTSSHGTSGGARGYPSEPLAAFILTGKTGSGKSSFIKLLGGRDLSGREPIVDGGTDSCTRTTTVYLTTIGGRKIVLLDTPGFDDSGVENLEILNDIVSNLYTFALRRQEIQTQGVIFLHDIGEKRYSGSQRKTLEILRALCGPEGMRSCIIGTTMWSSLGSRRYQEEETREGELRCKYWQGILKTTRIPENDVVAVTGIINDILARPPVLLLVQKEMLKPPHNLENTTVGKTAIPEGRAEADRLRKEYEDYQRQTREETEARGAEYRRQQEEARAQFEAEQARQEERAREREKEHRKREEEQERLHQERIRQMNEENQKRLREEENRRKEEERQHQENLRKMSEENQRQQREEANRRNEEERRQYQENLRQMNEENQRQLREEANRRNEEERRQREAERKEWKESMDCMREFEQNERERRREYDEEQRKRKKEADEEAERERRRVKNLEEEFRRTRAEPEPVGWFGKVVGAVRRFFGF